MTTGQPLTTLSPDYQPGPGALKRRARVNDHVRDIATGTVYLVTGYHGGRNPWVDVAPLDGGAASARMVDGVEVLSARFMADWSL